jgi:hypothetical protein
MNPEFIDLCMTTAKGRGQTLTEFTEQAMILNMTRKPITYKQDTPGKEAE